VREAEVDGDASRFLFWQTVGISSGQRFDQRALPVINVSSCSDDEMEGICHRMSVACRRYS
jgi:hypothetical protein